MYEGMQDPTEIIQSEDLLAFERTASRRIEVAARTRKVARPELGTVRE